jgi:tryptophan-rich sensory protein
VAGGGGVNRVFGGASGTSLGFGAGWILAVSMSGAWLTKLGPWYRDLRKPSWQPPDWLFGPVWTLIFVLSAVALVLAWNAPVAAAGDAAWLVGVYLLNGLLNVLWSFLFFRLHRPDWALREVPFLAGSVVLMMIVAGGNSQAAPWLLAPYLAWVSFAFYLNLTIVRLNAPFGGG